MAGTAGKLKWDETGKRLYETGTSKGVLFPTNATTGAYEAGVAWNGLTAVSASPSGADATDLWADDIKYLSMRAAEEFGGTIEAYTYPDEFAECDGTKEVISGVVFGQQTRRAFGFSWVTKVGNDVNGTDFGYKIHLVYGATASPSDKSYATISDSPEAITFSWEFETTPVNVTQTGAGAGVKAVAHIEIDSTKFTTDTAKARLTAFEDILYGKDADTATTTEAVAPRLPLPDEVISLLTV